MTSAWTNFAIFGDPTPPDTDLSWTPVNPNSEIQEYWNISGSKPIMETSQKIFSGNISLCLQVKQDLGFKGGGVRVGDC